MAAPAKRKKTTSRKPTGAAKPRPLKDLSPAYRARLQRHAKRQGITIAQLRQRGSGSARGHKPLPGASESQRRRAREDARIEAFAVRQAMKWPDEDGRDVAAEIAAAVRERVKQHGMNYLQRLERVIADLHERYMAQPDTRAERRSLGINMSDLTEEFDNLPVEAIGYH